MSDTDLTRARRRVEIERILARYPHLTPEALSELTDYFDRDASALDVGLIASNPDVAEPYRQFRARHIDPLGPRDWARGAGFAILMAGVVLAIVWPAL